MEHEGDARPGAGRRWLAGPPSPMRGLAAFAVLVVAALVIVLVRPLALGPATGGLPTPRSDLVSSFVEQTDGVFGYRMLRPANWTPEDGGLPVGRGYVAPGFEATRVQGLAMTVVNLQVAGEAAGPNGMIAQWTLFRQHPSLAGWTAAIGQLWTGDGYTFTLLRTLPNAKLYALTALGGKPTPVLEVVAFAVDHDQPLALDLQGSGTYNNLATLEATGIVDDLATMAGSLQATAPDQHDVYPALPTLAPGASFAPPTPAPSLGATAPASPDVPSSPSLDLGMPILPLAPDAVRTFAITEVPTAQGKAAAAGLDAFFGTAGGKGGEALVAVDVTTGVQREVAITLQPGELITRVAADDNWLTVLTAQPGDPCAQTPAAQRISWRILAAPLGPNGLPSAPFHRVDAGVAARPFVLPGAHGLTCAVPAIPAFAEADGRVAYAVESPTGSNAASSRVVVRALADGSSVGTYDAPAQVYAVTLSSDAIAWVETGNGLADGATPDWRVMEASLGGGTATQVPLPEAAGPKHPEPPAVVLDRTALVASLDQYSALSGTVVRVQGTQIETIDPGSPGRSCGAVGAADSVVVLRCDGSTRTGDVATTTASWVAVWSAGSGLRAVAGVPTAGPAEIWLQGGWLFWTTTEAQASTLVGVPATPLH